MTAYDKYWDTIQTEKTLIADAEALGIQKGEQIGIQKGEQIRIQKGKNQEKVEVVLALFDDKIPISQIAKYTKLCEDEVLVILRNLGRMNE